MHKYLLKLNGFERHVFVYIFGLKMGISIRCNCSFSEKKEQTLDTLTYNQSQTKASTSIRVILICDLLLHKHSKIPRLIFRMCVRICSIFVIGLREWGLIVHRLLIIVTLNSGSLRLELDQRLNLYISSTKSFIQLQLFFHVIIYLCEKTNIS